MRLIDVETLAIREFQGDEESPSFPKYAILSHRWGNEECTLQDMCLPGIAQRAGYQKIKFCCDQAFRDGLQWAWVDTCCIDKTSTAELSEAINSMFRWYRKSSACYAYLSDVSDITEFDGSKWFTRGWTLQELIAPKEVQFYSKDWVYLGIKTDDDLRVRLSGITNIDEIVLSTGQFEHVNIARRMTWMTKRQTTRVEDLAYCLLGIFDVNMPLLYGEGRKSFLRLQEEILKTSDDHTIFAWGLSDQPKTWEQFERNTDFSQMSGLLAESAAEFENCDKIIPLDDLQPEMPPIASSNGLHIRLPILARVGGLTFAAISCTTHSKYDFYLAVPLQSWGKRYKARCGNPVLIRSTLVGRGKAETLLVKPPPLTLPIRPKAKIFKVERIAIENDARIVSYNGAHCLPHAIYNPENSCILLSTPKNGPHAAFMFSIDMEWHSLKGGRDDTYDLKFALVVGGNPLGEDNVSAWVSFIPLLRERSKNKDFDTWFKLIGKWIKWCTPESQLQEVLRDDHYVGTNPSTGEFSTIFHEKLHTWSKRKIASGPDVYKVTATDPEQTGDMRGTEVRTHTLVIACELKPGPVNLVETGIRVYVRIFLETAQGQHTTPHPEFYYQWEGKDVGKFQGANK